MTSHKRYITGAFIMKYKLLITLLLLTIGFTVQADNSVSNDVKELQHEWAMIKYKTQRKKTQLVKYQELANKSHQLTQASPNSAELKIWEAIILSTQAGVKGGMGALKLVKNAKDLLLQAEKINPSALNGSAYTTLGSLYYQVPGWPIGFGNDKKANMYLKKALVINPKGIDTNFFYGDFLIKQKKTAEAIKVLKTALAAPKRPKRPIADAGRREEIKQLLKKAQAEL